MLSVCILCGLDVVPNGKDDAIVCVGTETETCDSEVCYHCWAAVVKGKVVRRIYSPSRISDNCNETGTRRDHLESCRDRP